MLTQSTDVRKSAAGRCAVRRDILRRMAGAVFGSLMLVSCGGPPSSPRGALLGESYLHIEKDYLQPIDARTLGLATLHGLSEIDKALTVSASPDELLLRRGDSPPRRFGAPSDRDWRGWGDTVAAMVEAASDSRVIARLPDDTMDTLLIRSELVVLDRYSRYIPPGHPSPMALLDEGTPAQWAPKPHRSPPPSLNEPPSASPGAVAASDGGSAVRIEFDRGIARIRLEGFTSGTGRVFRRALAAAAENGALRGVILDLRDNPGGEIAAAVEVAGAFLPSHSLVLTEVANSAELRIASTEPVAGLDRALPVAIIINGGTASAAEIVAAALQDHRRAVLIGSSSYGKGTIQRIFELANGGELWVTSTYSRAPSGYYIQNHGVLPDICTSFPAASARAAASTRVREVQYRNLLARPRWSLSDADWQELRALCPPAGPATNQAGDTFVAAKIVRDGVAP